MANFDDQFSSGGGGGIDIGTDFFSGSLQIASGAGVDFLTIPGVAGKKAVITGLGAPTSESNITITVGSRTVISNLTLNSVSTNVGEFSIGRKRQEAGDIDSIQGKENEAIVVSKTSGTTTQIIEYSYAYMAV
jgi:hypothetical protein